MSRRSGRSLTFADAVRLLDDGSPFVRDLDELIEHAFDAVPGGKLLGLPYFAFRSKLVAYGEQVVSGIRHRVDGVGRYDRTQRLHAAHAVIVMTAFAEATGEILDGADLRVERSDGPVRLSDVHGTLVLMFGELDTLDPGPSRVQWIEPLYVGLAQDLSRLLVTWGLENTEELLNELPSRARCRYDELYRRVAVQVPEFAVWAYLAEHKATRDELRDLGDELISRLALLTTGLAAVPELLAEVSGSAAANRVRIELARAYQAVLARSVLGETQAPEGFLLPTLERGYVNPAVRLSVVDTDCRPSEDSWWVEQPAYDNVQALIVSALTTPDAVDGQLVILGQPGAGKSVLTRVLAARLADRGFLPVRVELRNVPADADVQTQIEHAIRATIGRSIEWPELADSASDDGLLPLIILDGFDELLQATGVNRTDYLEQVAHFQRRERDLGRPVAAIVTSRTVVADRARFPEGASVVRIEPFDETRVATWLGVWNETNGTSLDAASVLRYGELAEQPLLLTLLALYEAETGELSIAGPELSRAELYDRLLTEFARREVRKSGVGLDDEQEHRAVADELHRLELVALAMFNRHAKSVTAAQLDHDLAREPSPVRHETGLAKPLTAAQLTIGRFFFVHESSAQRAGETEHAYEFLHATLEEFLVARHVVETLRALARDRAYFRSTGRPDELDDGKLWMALSFAALTGSAASVEFTEGLLCRLAEEERDAVREQAIELLRVAQYPNPRRSRSDYEPVRETVLARHAYYSANLTVLAVLSTGKPLDFYPNGMSIWPEALRYDEFTGLRETVRVLRVGSRGQIAREDGAVVDPYESGLAMWRSDDGLGDGDRLFTSPRISARSPVGRHIRELAFNPYYDWSMVTALLAYTEFVGADIGFMVSDGEVFVPVARGLLELRLAPFSAHGTARRCALYRWCFDYPECTESWLATVFRQLREDARELDPSDTADVLRYAVDRNALDDVSGGFLDALSALREVDEAQFRALFDEARFRELADSDERVRALLGRTDNPHK